MEIAGYIVAGCCAVLAVILGVIKQVREEENSSDVGWTASPGAATMSAKPLMRRLINDRGWKAPHGHYFNESGYLVNNLGETITDTMMIASLCNEEYAEEHVEKCTASASCCSEASAEVVTISATSYSSGDSYDSDDSGGDD